MILWHKYILRKSVPKYGGFYQMKKLSKGAYEDTKGFLRVAETLLEILILTVLYYIIWRDGYRLSAFAYKGKYVLMGVYAVLL